MAEILVFEDHVRSQEIIQRILERAGHKLFGTFVDHFGDIDNAITKAVAAGVKVAIVDGRLIGGGERDGAVIAIKLRRAGITSIAHATDHTEEMGADIVVGKVASSAALLNTVAQALGSFVR